MKVQDKKNKVLILCSRPRQNVKLCTFTCTKVVVLLYLNLLLFCHSCCHHRHCCLSFLLFLKGLCHVCLVHFVNNANCGSFLAMELEKLIENGKIKLQVKQIHLLSITSNITKTKMNFKKLLG